jgi:hypothetical protein
MHLQAYYQSPTSRLKKIENKMTRKLNIDNGLQDWKTKHQAVTAAHMPCPSGHGT